MANKQYKVLIAEDDKILIKALKDKLSREGFLVAMASDGDEALLKLKEEKPDIMLLDVMMPGKNGFEVLAEMKLNNGFKDVPVIIVSNLGQEIDIIKGKELGAVDYIVKSDLSVSGVVEKVKENLAKSKVQKINYVNF